MTRNSNGTSIRTWMKPPGSNDTKKVETSSDIISQIDFFFGDLKDKQKLKDQKSTVSGLGEIICQRESGMLVLPVKVDQDQNITSRFETWRNSKTLFGTVQLIGERKISINGMQFVTKFEFKLVKTGDGATTALPNFKRLPTAGS